MKTIYALMIACLSLQACNNQTETPTGSINVVAHSALDRAAKAYDDDYTMWTTLPTAEYWIGTTVVDDDTAAVAPAIQPIYGAEFDGTSRDDNYANWGSDDTESTASVNVLVPYYSMDIDGE